MKTPKWGNFDKIREADLQLLLTPNFRAPPSHYNR